MYIYIYIRYMFSEAMPKTNVPKVIDVYQEKNIESSNVKRSLFNVCLTEKKRNIEKEPFALCENNI